MIRRIFEWAWSMLPDKCEVPHCGRRGVRGNENRIDGTIMCDYCHAAYLDYCAAYRGATGVRFPTATGFIAHRRLNWSRL